MKWNSGLGWLGLLIFVMMLMGISLVCATLAMSFVSQGIILR